MASLPRGAGSARMTIVSVPSRDRSSPPGLLRRGKVRDVYTVDDDRLLLVATDRVSAFDVVMAEAIPRKGAVLTQLTAWWLRRFDGVLAHHMLASDSAAITAAAPSAGRVCSPCSTSGRCWCRPPLPSPWSA